MKGVAATSGSKTVVIANRNMAHSVEFRHPSIILPRLAHVKVDLLEFLVS